VQDPSAAFCTAPAASRAIHVNQRLWVVCIFFRERGNGTPFSLSSIAIVRQKRKLPSH
jgi:hypothetical protein